jgi:butyrate kinase
VCRENHRIAHPDEVLDRPLFPDQHELRQQQILKYLAEAGYRLAEFQAIAARGGRLKPVKSGVYRVNEQMAHHARIGLQGQHPANLAVVIAWTLSHEFHIPAFTVDPISVDELDDVARITGIKQITRCSLSHALNMKAAAKKAAQDLGMPYDAAKLIVVHLGGGGSISAHLQGRMVDIYNSDKEGPFAVERAGFIPTLDLLDFLEQEHLTPPQAVLKLAHEGGFFSHFGTRDIAQIERLCDANPSARLVLQAYIYGIAKGVCSFLPLFGTFLDAVVFTGGVCHSKLIQQPLKEQLGFLGKLLWYPGEFEMESLALNTLAVLQGERAAYEY